jgi:hypothetical protein
VHTTVRGLCEASNDRVHLEEGGAKTEFLVAQPFGCFKIWESTAPFIAFTAFPNLYRNVFNDQRRPLDGFVLCDHDGASESVVNVVDQT